MLHLIPQHASHSMARWNLSLSKGWDQKIVLKIFFKGGLRDAVVACFSIICCFLWNIFRILNWNFYYQHFTLYNSFIILYFNKTSKLVNRHRRLKNDKMQLWSSNFAFFVAMSEEENFLVPFRCKLKLFCEIISFDNFFKAFSMTCVE